MKQIKVEGIIPAIVTPFNHKGDVEFEYLKNVVRFHLKSGVHGFFVCGSAGEGPLMSLEQRKTVAEAVLKEVANQVPVIVHVGAANTMDAVELAKHANEVGAAAIGAVSPYYFNPDLEGLLAHYKLIAESVDMPVFVYNIPKHTGFNITPEIMKKLCEIENVVGVKESSGNMMQAQEIIESMPKPLIFINGADDLIFATFMVGATAQVSAIANVIPELLVRLYENFKNGEYREALNLQTKINAVKRALDGPPIAPLKAALELRGIKAGVPKRPLRPLRMEEILKLKERLRSYNII